MLYTTDIITSDTNKFPELQAAKIITGILAGTEIRQMIRDSDYTNFVTITIRRVWMKFVGALNNFLGKKLRELKANCW